MGTDLWIVCGTSADGHLGIVGTFLAEHDPLPGLKQVLDELDPNAWAVNLYAMRVEPERTVSLYGVVAVPRLDGPVWHVTMNEFDQEPEA